MPVRYLILIISLRFLRCSSDDSETSSDSSATNFGQLNISLSDTEAVVPQDVAITSVTEQQSLAAIEVVQGRLQTGSLVQGEKNDYLTRLESLKNTTTTEDIDSCMAAIPEEFNLAQGNLGHATCFGPAITGNSVDIGNGDAGIWWDFSTSSRERLIAVLLSFVSD